MQKTGIVRQVDEMGRFVIPKEMRLSLGIVAKDPIEIRILDDGGIGLYKYDAAMSIRDSVTHLKMRVGEDDLMDPLLRVAAMTKLIELEALLKRRARQ